MKALLKKEWKEFQKLALLWILAFACLC